MAKRRLLDRPAVQAPLAWLAARYIRLLARTTRWERRQPPAVERLFAEAAPAIFCFWHGRLALVNGAWQGDPARLHLLISGHATAGAITRAMRRLGHGVVTGSGSTPSRGGARALAEMQAVLADGGAVALTPDGPKGPLMRVKGGAILAAQATGAPLVPVTAAVAAARRLSTWDRFCLARPWSRGVILFGEPVAVPPDAGLGALEAARRSLEESLIALTAEADRRCGHAPLEAAPDSGRRPKSRKRKKKAQP